MFYPIKCDPSSDVDRVELQNLLSKISEAESKLSDRDAAAKRFTAAVAKMDSGSTEGDGRSGYTRRILEILAR
jgi:hypothetical protein